VNKSHKELYSHTIRSILLYCPSTNDTRAHLRSRSSIVLSAGNRARNRQTHNRPGSCIRLSINLNTDIRTHNCTKSTAVAVFLVMKNAVMVSRSVEIIGHYKYRTRTGVHAELAPLTALSVDDNSLHRNLHNTHSSTLLLGVFYQRM